MGDTSMNSPKNQRILKNNFLNNGITQRNTYEDNLKELETRIKDNKKWKKMREKDLKKQEAELADLKESAKSDWVYVAAKEQGRTGDAKARKAELDAGIKEKEAKVKSQRNAVKFFDDAVKTLSSDKAKNYIKRNSKKETPKK